MKRVVIVCVGFVLAAAFLAACGGKENPSGETLSVDPLRIDAPKDKGSYKLAVTSNAAWTANFQDAGGTALSWGVLDRSSGTGDATLTLRLYENKYNVARSGSLVVKTTGGVVATVSVVQEGDSGSQTEQVTVKMRIGSYNLRGSWLTETKPENDWSLRQTRLGQSIRDCAFDIVGMQEVGADAQSWLSSNFSDTYTFKFFSPYSQNGTGDRSQAVGWRTDTFTMSEWNYFWMGDTPGTMSRNDTGASGNYNRGGCCCVLTHKATGLKIFLMNTHGCMNSGPNWDYAPQFERMEKQYNQMGLPSFFVGDMNSTESSEPGSPYMVYTSYWKDSYKEVPGAKRSGCIGTFNGYSAPTGKNRIDMVFFRGGNPTVADTYTCKNTLYGGLYASDHFPVFVDFTVTN